MLPIHSFEKSLFFKPFPQCNAVSRQALGKARPATITTGCCQIDWIYGGETPPLQF
jgi:hypothetical protein